MKPDTPDDMPDDAAFARLMPDTPPIHAALKVARESVRQGDFPTALALLDGPKVQGTPLADLLRADLLLATGKAREAEALALEVTAGHGDTGQGLLCAGHAALARGDREAAGERFVRAQSADPGRIAARVNAAALPTGYQANQSPSADEPLESGRVVAVTSLPPRTDARHRAAVASFVLAGFSPIISVNTPREIEALWQDFPDVTFVPGPDAAARPFGRPFAALDDLLAAGAATGAQAVAIINADIVLAPPAGLAARLGRAALGGAVLACRVDVANLAARSGQYYDVGFDVCAVDAGLARRIDLKGFYLGLPWWDYALPLAVLAAGGRLGFGTAPGFRHTVHASGWSNRHFLTLGRRFARRFCPAGGEFLFPPGETAASHDVEACLGGIGARAAAFLRRSPGADLGRQPAFCPHDPGYAAASLPLTRVVLTRD